MSSIADVIYSKLPVSLQNMAVSMFGLYWHWLRFGPGFDKYARGFREREAYSGEEWQDWVQKELTRLLALSVENVRYYRDNYTESQKRSAKRGELSALPLLEKEALRQDPRAFVRQDIQTKEFVYYTSGTTGTPIASIWTLHDNRRALAIREARSANWAGVSFSMPRATFSGRLVEPNPESKGPYYRYNAVEKQVYLSAFHLKPDTAKKYVEALWKHKVEWLTGYAVSYYLLARFILEQEIAVPPLKAVITTSEKLTAEMRSTMQQAYGCRIYEEYSTVENALFASECEMGNLHVSPDAGVVEILRPDGSSCDVGEVGEVVATCLSREYQPLIRFRLGDLAAWSENPCSCGRSMPVIKEVVGRIEDVVVGSDGRQMVRFGGVFFNQPHVREGQIIQESLQHIHVKILPATGFGTGDVENIIHRVQQRLGVDIEVSVECVDQIPRTRAGKVQSVISHIKQLN